MKQHKTKKVYTKSDYVYMYSKLTVITGTFATIGMSLALFLGFVVTLIGHDRLDISSQLSLVLFILSLPVVIRKVKHYKAVQNRLQGKCPADTKETIASQVTLPNRKAVWTGIIRLSNASEMKTCAPTDSRNLRRSMLKCRLPIRIR